MPTLKNPFKDTSAKQEKGTKGTESAATNTSKGKSDAAEDWESTASTKVAESEMSTTHRKSWFEKISHHGNDNKEKKRPSISDSGPFIFVKNADGKEVLQRNPHWPNEDSWVREKQNEGQWAFGSMAGQQNQDFGGTVG